MCAHLDSVFRRNRYNGLPRHGPNCRLLQPRILPNVTVLSHQRKDKCHANNISREIICFEYEAHKENGTLGVATVNNVEQAYSFFCFFFFFFNHKISLHAVIVQGCTLRFWSLSAKSIVSWFLLLLLLYHYHGKKKQNEVRISSKTTLYRHRCKIHSER